MKHVWSGRTLLLLFSLAIAGGLRAQVVDFTWLSTGPDAVFSNSANWQGGVLPTNDGTARLVFPSSGNTETVQLTAGNLSINSLFFNVGYPGTNYTFTSASSTLLTITPSSSYGQTSTNAGYARTLGFAADITLNFAANQIWTAQYLTFNGSVGGAGEFRYDPLSYYGNSLYNRGTLTLNGANNFAGGFNAYNANLVLGHANALAGGPLTLADVTIDAAAGYSLGNTMTLSAGFSTVKALTLTGPITLAGNTNLSGPLTVNGNISESVSTTLGINSGTVHLAGTNTYTGGTAVGSSFYSYPNLYYTPATLIFDQASAVPATGTISANVQSYVGVAFTTGLQTGFLNHLSSEGFVGTIGFDSPGATQTFAENINLGGLANPLGLGSSTSALLTGTITTGFGGTDYYRFGNGGGTLYVASNLTLPVGLEVITAGYLVPTTVVLQGNNTFSGFGVDVDSGIVIFNSANALPAAVSVVLGTNTTSWDFAYAGLTENSGVTPAALLSRISVESTSQPILGLDSANPASPRTVTDNIDLTPALLANDVDNFFIGTATGVTLTGTLTTGAEALALTGLKGATLTVNSLLTDAVINGVVIGLANVDGATQGTVRLNGANTYTRGTLWQSGDLILGNNTALGTGPLMVDTDGDDHRLSYSGDLTVANRIIFSNSYDTLLSTAASSANLTLTGAVGGNTTRGFDYRGAGTLTYAGTNRILGGLTINAAPGGSVVYARPGGISANTELVTGSLSVNADTRIRLLTTAPSTTVQIGAGATLGLIENNYSEGPAPHVVAGTLTGAGALYVEDNAVALVGNNSYTGGTTLHGGSIGFNLGSALGTGPLTVTAAGGFLVSLAADLTLANPITLMGALEVNGSNYFGYANYPLGANRDLTLSGVISGPGALTKSGSQVLTLNGDNTFGGGILIEEGTVVFAHDHAAGSGPLSFGYYSDGIASFTTAAPVIGGLESDYYGGGLVQLAGGSNLTINQALDSTYSGGITGAGARVTKTGAGYLTITGSGPFGYSGGTQINDGGIIFDSGSLLAAHAAGGIQLGAATGYAGLGAGASVSWADFLAKISPTSSGTIGLDGEKTVNTPFDLTGFTTGLRLGSATFGVVGGGAVITPNGDYRFGGGGGTLLVSSPLTGGATGLDLASPATQPLTLWLLNDNYFGGAMTVTHSAAIFGPHSIDYLSGIQIGTGGYVGSVDSSLTPDAFMAHLNLADATGIVGFDDPGANGRVVGNTIHAGPQSFLGSATRATLRGPIVLAMGDTAYRFAGYKGGELEVASALTGANSVVIGDLSSFGTMRDPHDPNSYSTVALSGLNTYTGGTTLNAGTLVVRAQSLGTGALTVAANAFPATEDPVNMLPQLKPETDGATLANNIVLNGSLRLGGSDEATLSGLISGAGGLVFTRDDYSLLTLSNANTYTGGTTLVYGRVGIGHNSALGSGTITVQPYGRLVAVGADRTLSNPIQVVTSESANTPTLEVSGKYDLTFNGAVNFAGLSSQVYVNASDSPGRTLRFNGGISGATGLQFNTGGRVWVGGVNTYTVGTRATGNTQLIFDSVAALPAFGALSSSNNGYIGLATPTASLQADFIERFNSDYYQVIGLDSPNVAAPQTFTADIDLRGFNYAQLSSATAAILSGTILPQTDDVYRFSAQGGGILTVTSALTGHRDLEINDSNAPFLLRLAGTNTFTGSVDIYGGGLIFTSAASLPDTTGKISVNQYTSGYVGSQDPTVAVADFLTHFDANMRRGIVGFDSADVNAPRTITSPNLGSHFTGDPTNIFLGTATRLIVDGTITWPSANEGMGLAAYRTGWLTVNSILGDDADLIIGDPFQAWTLREIDGAFPTVELAAANTFAGNTRFYGGQLMLSNAGALSSGNLELYDSGSTAQEVHRLLLNTAAINNNIYFMSSSVNLRVATTQSLASLGGSIEGGGQITKEGLNTVRLTGNNSFSGLYTVVGGTLEFATAGAVGSIATQLNFDQAGGVARFMAGNPIIGSLSSERLVPATVQLDAGVDLTVGGHDNGYSYEESDYYGALTGAGSLTKDGLNTLTLYGASTYSGGTTVAQGTLVAAHANALGTGAVTIAGGLLAFAPGITISNAIDFAGAGKLGGSTTFAGPVVLSDGGGLSPGNSPGTMTFGSNLTLGGASFLDFEIQDPTGLAGSGYDTVVVGGTLFITATSASPFVINILSLDGAGNGGPLTLSDPDATYSLRVVSAGAISGFAPENFTLNTAGFTTNFGNSYEFTLVQNGNDLNLNFKAVPEPSTYALLGLGGLLAALARRRARG